jgi:uncharacterized membrane protein (UPF0127 family)
MEYAMKAVLTSGGQELAANVAVASSLPARIRGLLGSSSLPAGQGLLIKPCKGIHTFFMKFSIDVIFLDRHNRIVALHPSLPPNRMTRIYLKAVSVLELPSGTLGGTVAVGDVIDFS